jgi:hypothetical protein
MAKGFEHYRYLQLKEATSNYLYYLKKIIKVRSQHDKH